MPYRGQLGKSQAEPSPTQTGVCRPFILAIAALAAAFPLPAVAQTWPRDASSIDAACTSALASLDASVAMLRHTKHPTFANTIAPLEQRVSDARDALAPELLAWRISPDAAVQRSSHACAARARTAFLDLASDPQVGASVARAASTAGTAQRRALAQYWQQTFARGGASLDRRRRERYAAAARDLTLAQVAFEQNLASDRTTIRIDGRSARGLPSDLTATFSRNRDGSYDVPVDAGTREFLRFESNEDAREAYYRARNRRAADQNVNLLQRAIAARERIAHILGSESWAEYRLRTTPLGGLQSARAFAANAVTAYASARPSPDVAPWNLEFHQRTSLAPRSVEETIGDVASVTGTVIAPAGKAPWGDGSAYDVSDAATQRPLGTLLVDFTRTPGTIGSDDLYVLDAARAGRGATVAVVASWPHGARDVLDGAYVPAFYADLGRAMASLLATTPYASLNEPDAAAAAVDAAVFETLARPNAAERRRGLRDSVKAEIDLAFSSSGSHVDTTSTWARIAQSDFPESYDPGTYPQIATSDFIGDSAGLLVLRPWARATANDATAGLADGRIDAAAGMRYRQSVLAPAASRGLADELHDFLGRAPQTPLP